MVQCTAHEYRVWLCGLCHGACSTQALLRGSGALEEGHCEEALAVLHLPQDLADAVCQDVDHLDSERCRIQHEVPRLVEGGVQVRSCRRLHHVLLDGEPAASVQSVHMEAGVS